MSFKSMNVLFMCTANSCRSQMAEAWAGQLFPQDWQVSSCGLVTYRITSSTRRAMAEVGLDMTGQAPQSLDEYDLNSFDLIVTLSREAGQFLPALEDPSRHCPSPVEDPMSAKGDAEEVGQAFRDGRDKIKQVVQDVVSGVLGPGSNPLG